MKKIAILTSGGDAAGMNAAIRAITRTGLDKGWEMFGVRDGFSGLIEGNFIPLGARDVGGIIEKGGTMLGSARCAEFMSSEGQQKALEQLQKKGINGLVVIGGNGSQTGSNVLSELGFPVIGIGSTIDNDLFGAEITIGVDTALNIALESIDRLKVTASSHKRAFLVEVMGRNCGYLALMAGIAGGAEAIVIPEINSPPDEVAAELLAGYKRGKSHAIVVVAEGAEYNAEKLADYFKANQERTGFRLGTTKLGHVQRGGTPSVFDRLLATRLGAAATDYFARENYGLLLGWIKGEIAATPLSEVAANQKAPDLKLMDLADVLAK
ncbi:MAG: 6-phosphofructokinase [Pyrinomonadaceae bacterium]|nr:6-phosphofructokinase [Pyrinomonadaceae bacterium]